MRTTLLAVVMLTGCTVTVQKPQPQAPAPTPETKAETKTTECGEPLDFLCSMGVNTRCNCK